MGEGVEKIAPGVLSLRDLYRVIGSEMAAVDQLLREELQSSRSFIDRMLRHGLQLGGKRLRPALVILSAKLCGNLCEAHIPLAVAVELIHTASLIHDDVLDDAQMRRHLETMNARWDNEASVLLGDYLLAKAMCLVTSLDSMYACQEMTRASHEMCEGELRQIAARGEFNLSEEEYLQIIAEKTAALCRTCCRLGAYFAGATPEWVERLGRFGTSLGIAFQITDDILDVLGEEAKTGKSLGSDLAKQKPTLPIIQLLRQSSGHDREEVLRVLRTQPEGYRRWIREKLQECGAIAYSQEKAQAFALAAVAHIADLPPSQALEALQQLAAFVVTRDC